MMDLAIVGVLLLFTVMGWRSGLIRGLVGLAAMVLALVLSAQLARAAAPEIVDRYLRPATYAAIEERAEALSRSADASSIEELRQNLYQVLDAIPNDFIRDRAQDALDGVLPAEDSIGGALRAPLEELGVPGEAVPAEELWTGERFSAADGALTAKLPAHGCALLQAHHNK